MSQSSIHYPSPLQIIESQDYPLVQEIPILVISAQNKLQRFVCFRQFAINRARSHIDAFANLRPLWRIP